jgi:putative glutathione S-transferase
LFEALDWVENILSSQKFLVGNTISEADWRLFTTLVRFDSVYVGHFKTNKQTIISYPNIWNYVKALYQVKGIEQTVYMDQIKHHYYFSHTMINPTQVVPKGPELNFMAPHNR